MKKIITIFDINKYTHTLEEKLEEEFRETFGKVFSSEDLQILDEQMVRKW